MEPTVIAACITALATLLVAVVKDSNLPRLLMSVKTSGVSLLAFGAFITGVIGLVGLASQVDGIDQSVVAIGERLEPIEDQLGGIVPEIRALVAPIESAVTVAAQVETGPREPSFDDLTEAPQPDESAELARHGTSCSAGTHFFFPLPAVD